jgi:hypothetical protein
MKKSTQLRNWLEEKISNFFGTEIPDIKKNEQEIMNLFFYSNFNKLPTKDTLELFKNVEKKLVLEMKKRGGLFESDSEAIKNFLIPANTFKKGEEINLTIKQSIKEKVKEHISNPVFDKPLTETSFPEGDLPFGFPFEPMSNQEFAEYIHSENPVDSHPNIEVIEFNKI